MLCRFEVLIEKSIKEINLLFSLNITLLYIMIYK